ncbi:hypothetical protein AB6A40_000791 [Gnathostoma spinigerum]|uniref:JNK-interacting protein 3 n=1 Tax=Gnathostoma spinigerum TaxID=75299 RepID=A0ABD6E4V9_9BILA
MVEAQGNEMQTSATSSSSEVFCGVAAGSGGSSEDSSRVMSEKVQMLASSIYKELELMIQKCGEENVKSLMPLVVNVLESLDLAYLEKEEYSVDLEMLKEDNEQLVTQYEREKQLRRAQDQKCIEIEDALVEQNRELESKIESLESIMRMLELKAKNASDHATRLEEREADQKAEFDKLHERYNVLLRTHIDHMERTKYLMGSDKFDMMQSMPIPSQQFRTKMGMATSVDAQTIRGVSDIISAHMSQSTTMDVNLANHISNEDWQDEFGQSATEILQPAQGPLVAESPRAESESVPETGTVAPSQEEDPSAEDPGDSLGADLTGALVDPAEFASAVNDTFIGMGREVENLIKENNELLETKNALNIVKNDLIARVDELSSEQDILRDEIRSLEMVRTKMNERIKELETEVKSLKEQSESKDGSQDEVQSAERKRFTRVEMSKVVGERNYYKEKLMELQEAVKWTELQRAKKLHAISSKKRSSIWEFFSGLFTHESVPSRNVHQQVCRSYGVNDSCQKKVAKNADFLDPDYASERRAAERRQQYKIVKEHMAKRDDGRQQACGWSIPVDVSNKDNTCIPIPVFCRPLNDVESHLKLSCAAGVILRGGRNRDGVYICDDKVRSEPSLVKVESPSTEKPASGPKDKEMLRWESSSLLWVCNSSQGNSTITILDVYNPNGVIDTFATCSSHLLCISSIPGVLEAHQTFDDEEWKRFVRGGGGVRDVPPDLHDHDEFGAVTWVELRKLVSDEDPTPTYCGPNQVPSPTRARDFSECEASAVTASTSGDEGLNSVGSLLEDDEKLKKKDQETEKSDDTTEGADELQSNVTASKISSVYIPLEKLKAECCGSEGIGERF